MQLYYFTAARYALSNIERRRVKISRLDNLNDPFEWIGPACAKESDRKFLRDMKRQMGEKSGLICFSEDWTNPVHWSHYADHHRGMCLGFEVDPVVVEPVTYSEERTELEDLGAALQAAPNQHKWLMQEVICRKFRDWQYEKEWRAHTHLDPATVENGNYFLDFSQQLRLNKVIVGSRCEHDRATVERAIGDLQGVTLIKARLAFKAYAVCEQKDSKHFN